MFSSHIVHIAFVYLHAAYNCLFFAQQRCQLYISKLVVLVATPKQDCMERDGIICS